MLLSFLHFYDERRVVIVDSRVDAAGNLATGIVDVHELKIAHVDAGLGVRQEVNQRFDNSFIHSDRFPERPSSENGQSLPYWQTTHIRRSP